MTTVHLYRSGDGEWRWRAKAANGEVVADSSEGYVRRIDAVAGAYLVCGADVEIRQD